MILKNNPDFSDDNKYKDDAWRGFSTKEIAKLLHIKDVNVRSRMSRGRKQLEQYLQEYALG